MFRIAQGQEGGFSLVDEPRWSCLFGYGLVDASPPEHRVFPDHSPHGIEPFVPILQRNPRHAVLWFQLGRPVIT